MEDLHRRQIMFVTFFHTFFSKFKFLFNQQVEKRKEEKRLRGDRTYNLLNSWAITCSFLFVKLIFEFKEIGWCRL
tara:strand:+ start:184 stop:408 length:225 start_codon:yes stop_codon:yes gene_type:complete